MATKYLVSGGNGDWTNSSNWSLTSGGPGGTGQPNSADDVIIDANSLNTPLRINAAVSTSSVYMSNYTGVMTYNNTLSVAQAFEYSTGMTTINGGGALTLGSAGGSPASVCSVNFNGVTHNAILNFNNLNLTLTTYTITGDLNVIGSVNFANSNLSGSGTKAVVNGGNILCNSGFSIYGNGNRWITGTSTIYFVGSGSGTFTSGVSAFFLNMNIVFQKTGGVINMTSGAIYTRGTGITYISGVFTNFILAINTSSAVLDTAGMTWASISVGGGSLTNNSLCTVSGTFSNSSALNIGGAGNFSLGNISSTNNLTFTSGVTVNVAGNVSIIGTAATPLIFGSSTSGVQINFYLNVDGTQDVAHVTASDVNSNGAKTIYDFRAPSLTNTNNWSLLPMQVGPNVKTILR